MSLNKRLILTTPGTTPDEAFFNTVLYSGNGSTQSITGVGFKPDLVWIKPRNQVENHHLADSTRGSTNQLAPNSTSAAREQSNTITSFDSDGFTTGNDNNTNSSNINYVAWCWRAGGGTTSSNSDGSITSTVQASPLSGFSIVKYTGTGSNATIGHGLSTAPDWIIMKNLDRAGYGWLVYHQAIGEEKYKVLNTDAGATDQASIFNDTAPTSSVFSVGTDTFGNYNGDDYIAYCWHDVSGFSSFGSYTGNGSTTGPVVNIGFEPDFVLFKRDSGDSWRIFDSARSTSNTREEFLDPHTTAAETTSQFNTVDFVSNGFQPRCIGSTMNNSGGTYLHHAFKITH